MEAVSLALISERGGVEPPTSRTTWRSQSILAIKRDLHVYTKTIALAIFFLCGPLFLTQARI
jgi:hypothetical protein